MALTRWPSRLVVQLVTPTLAALLAVSLLAVPFASHVLTRQQEDTVAARLAREAAMVGEALPWESGAALDAACVRLGTALGVRVTVVDPSGRVLGESARASASLEDDADRPELRGAMALGEGRSVRRSDTLDRRFLYVAIRQHQAGATRVVRLALPLDAVAASVARWRALVLAAILAAAVLGLGAALGLSRHILRRIRRLVGFADRLASGDPPVYLAPERDDDLGLLEAQLGDMARRVAATIAELRVERERLEAILRGMVEGVLVTDLDGVVVLLNRRARDLLAVPARIDPVGRRLAELARDPALGDLLRAVADGVPATSRDVALGGGAGPRLQVNAARLAGVDGRPFGVVLVLHDVTELRRLEVVRRDFVANVSHELRTPLTAIKGFAETLLGPAGDDRATARRFLQVIDRHSERLGRLIDDLLALSDLELGRTPLRIGSVVPAQAIDDVLQIFAGAAARVGVTITADVDAATPPLSADGDRVRQVLINLVDNAVKHTPAGGRVTVRAAPVVGGDHGAMAAIVVEDTGVGIPAQDLPRLTERFFRVDKARSRELGGTGLGLAIVKHIVQAHGGSLSIASMLGQGTAVRVLLPAHAGERQAMPEEEAS